MKKKTKRTTINKKTRQSVYNKYNGRCAYCGQPLKYEEMQVDHFAPVHLFGDNTREENLMPACRMCNFYKSTYTISKFREELGKLTSRLERDSFIYRLAKKYNMIKETNNDKEIKFYFEVFEDSSVS